MLLSYRFGGCVHPGLVEPYIVFFSLACVTLNLLRELCVCVVEMFKIKLRACIATNDNDDDGHMSEFCTLRNYLAYYVYAPDDDFRTNPGGGSYEDNAIVRSARQYTILMTNRRESQGFPKFFFCRRNLRISLRDSALCSKPIRRCLGASGARRTPSLSAAVWRRRVQSPNYTVRSLLFHICPLSDASTSSCVL